MTKEELAAILNGREYLEEISVDENEQAEEAGLVVVFGESDDTMEFYGAVRDEIGCYGGGTALIGNDGGLLRNACHDDRCPYFADKKRTARTIQPVWGEGGYSWTYRTTIPHATFEIVDDNSKYCLGIIYSIDDLGDQPCQEPS